MHERNLEYDCFSEGPLYHSPVPPVHTQPPYQAWRPGPDTRCKIYNFDKPPNNGRAMIVKVNPRSGEGSSTDTEALYQARYFNPRYVVPKRVADPVSLSDNITAVDGCGGHCTTCQNFCYYFMQVVFIIIILSGIAFCGVAILMRRNKTHDLSVLVYIGSLISIVSTVLLSIQYCVRRNVKQRKKALKVALNAIPMTEIVPTLPVRKDVPYHSSYDRHTRLPDRNGIPWWRRQD